MTAAVVDNDPFSAAGPGWTAEIYFARILLAVDPDEGDVLPAALDVLFQAWQKPFWTVEHAGVNDAGWDVYLLTREP